MENPHAKAMQKETQQPEKDQEEEQEHKEQGKRTLCATRTWVLQHL
jgi:hypothetical protein